MTNLEPGAPGSAAPGGGAPGPGPSGDSAAAQEHYDFSQSEGLPSQHASLQWEVPEVGTLSLRVKLSSYVFVPSTALVFTGGCMVFAYKMRETPYAGAVLISMAVLTMIVLISAGWFAHRLLRQHKPKPEPEKPVDLRRRIPHNTTDRVLPRNKKKLGSANSKPRRGPRRRR